jgi:transcriptional regulator with XRE-family HTH domain
MATYRFSGARLRVAREAARLSRVELGTGVEPGASVVTLWELHYRTPPIDKLAELADVLGVYVEEFFEVTDGVTA